MINVKPQESLTKAYISLAGGVAALTISPLFVRWADAPGIVISFYRMFLTTIMILVVGRVTKKISYSPSSRRWLIFPVLGGIASAIDHGLWSTSIEQTTVANATLLNNISPLWVGLFAYLILREKLRGAFWVGILLVISGAVMVLGSTFFARPSFASGDFLALGSSLFYAVFFLSTQEGRKGLKTLQYLLVMSATAAVVLGCATAVLKIPLLGYSPQTNLLFLISATVSQFGAYFMISYSMGRLPASVVTPTMVIQPVLTTLLAIPIVGEKLIPLQALGGLLTVGGVYMVNRVQLKKTPHPEEVGAVVS